LFSVAGSMSSIFEISTPTGKVYLLEGKERSILVDALNDWYEKKIIRSIRKRGENSLGKVKLILLTHGHLDHFGGAPGLKRRLGCMIAIHQMDVEGPRSGRNLPLSTRNRWEKMTKPFVSRIRAEPFEPDVMLEGDEGDLFDFGIEAKWIRTPGHTEGSISIVFPGQTAIVGDLVVGRFNAPRKPAYPLWVKDPGPVRASVRKVLDYSPKTLLSGHGGPLDADDVRRFFSLV
jgi:glyoxylase-like metal-dependent hydrolase (beta-lactamase superfamily II)